MVSLGVNQVQIENRSAVISAIILNVIGISGFLILPLLVGAAAKSLNFNEQELGFMGSAIMASAAISSIFAIFWIRKINWQFAGFIALLLMCFAHVFALFVEQKMFFTILIALSSFGGGTLYAVALTALSDSTHADRYFGYSIAAQVSFQVVSLMILPPWIEQFGIHTILTLFIIIDVIGLVLLRWLPSCGFKTAITDISAVILKPTVLFALLGCFMFFFNVGVFWTYIERIGNNVGFSAENVGISLSIGAFFGIPGALLAAWIRERFGRILPLTLGALITVIAVYMLIADMSINEYTIALALYNFAWNFSLTFQYAVVNAVDTTGRSIAAAPAFHALGGATGPAIAAWYVTADSFNAVNLLSIFAVIISLLFFIMANSLRKEPQLSSSVNS